MNNATKGGDPLHPSGVPGEFPEKIHKVAILHHWDADGISSAAQLALHLTKKGISVFTMPPTLGNFFLEQEELEEVSSFEPDIMIVVDICVSRPRTLEMVEKLKIPIWIIDHHKIDPIPEVFHINPIAYGHDPKSYPSASYIVSKWLGRKDDLLTYFGVAGDWEERAKGLSMYPDMEKILTSNGLTFEKFQEIVSLLDASYKIGNKDAVAEAVSVLMEEEILASINKRTDWVTSMSEVDKLIGSITSVEPTEVRPNVLEKKIATPASVISPVTRKLSKANPNSVIMVINEGYFPTRDQIYIRTALEQVDLSILIDAVRPWAFSVGGKKEVAGIVVEKGEVPRIEQELTKVLEGANI